MTQTLIMPLRLGQRPAWLGVITGGLLATGRAIWRVMVILAKRHAERRAFRAFASLDDSVLKDIGIGRSEIHHLVRHGRDAVIAARQSQ